MKINLAELLMNCMWDLKEKGGKSATSRGRTGGDMIIIDFSALSLQITVLVGHLYGQVCTISFG